MHFRIYKFSVKRFLASVSNAALPVYSYPGVGALERSINMCSSGNLRARIVGCLSILKICAGIILVPVYFPISVICYFLNYRIFLVDMHQIGTATFVDWHVRKNMLLGSKFKIIIFRSETLSTANYYLLDRYKKHVFYVKPIILRTMLLPLCIFKYITENSLLYDIGGTSSPCAKRIFNEYVDKFTTPIISYSKEEDERLQACLNDQFGLSSGRYVTLHVRTSDFYNETRESLRNSSLETYENGVKFLVDNGLKVVLVGDNSSKLIDLWKGKFGASFVDYSNSQFRTKLTDIYILSKPMFHIGTNSGLSLIAAFQHVPTLWVNMYFPDASLGYLSADLSVFKTFNRNGVLLSLNEHFSEPFCAFLGKQKIEDLGLILEDNTEDDIYFSVVEMYNNIKIGHIESEAQRNSKSMLQYSSFSYYSRSNFSNSFLAKFDEFRSSNA